MKERLQKILSARGVASRRHAEELITAGRVTVNGQTATLGESADGQLDEILLDGRPLPSAPDAYTYIVLHKPIGYVTTMSDEKGRRNVSMLTRDAGVRIYPVGRLDINTSGLLIMTNDGELTQRLTHPRHEVDKQYHVTVSGDVESALPVLRSPIRLPDGYRIRPALVDVLGSNGEGGVISVTIREGRNRQVRLMCEAADLAVRRLARIRVGPLRLTGLAPGQWRHLTSEEVAYFKN